MLLPRDRRVPETGGRPVYDAAGLQAAVCSKMASRTSVYSALWDGKLATGQTAESWRQYVDTMTGAATHAGELEALAQALLKYETLDAEDVKSIVEGNPKRLAAKAAKARQLANQSRYKLTS